MSTGQGPAFVTFQHACADHRTEVVTHTALDRRAQTLRDLITIERVDPHLLALVKRSTADEHVPVRIEVSTSDGKLTAELIERTAK